jgi:antitoxin (DNA-binding transcriptional repressor) of toxin-antitoxin stability system
MTVADAAKNFATLVNKVYSEGISINLERDNQVIARLTPAERRITLTVGELNTFLSNLPRLGEDGDAFADDARAIRDELPAEANPWD